MNLKTELQKMNVSDLRYICKEIGIKCPKSGIIKRLLEPLKISYRMNKRKREMKCSEINELKVSYKNPIDKTRKIRDECQKRDDCTWTIHPGNHNFQCMSKNYIKKVRPRIMKMDKEYEKYKKKPKLNKFNQLIEKAHEEDVKSGDYYDRAFKRMKTLQQKNRDLQLFELFEKIDMNDNPQGPKSIYAKYTVEDSTPYDHY